MAQILTKLTAALIKAYSRLIAGYPAAQQHFIAGFSGCAKRLRTSRRAVYRAGLFLAELAGVVLVAIGIAQWSWPCAVITGGLVLVAAIEVRPSAQPSMPDIPPPEELLRHQAENSAVLINNARYGLAFADPDRLAKLTINECEQLIVAARGLGVKT